MTAKSHTHVALHNGCLWCTAQQTANFSKMETKTMNTVTATIQESATFAAMTTTSPSVLGRNLIKRSIANQTADKLIEADLRKMVTDTVISRIDSLDHVLNGYADSMSIDADRILWVFLHGAIEEALANDLNPSDDAVRLPLNRVFNSVNNHLNKMPQFEGYTWTLHRKIKSGELKECYHKITKNIEPDHNEKLAKMLENCEKYAKKNKIDFEATLYAKLMSMNS